MVRHHHHAQLRQGLDQDRGVRDPLGHRSDHQFDLPVAQHAQRVGVEHVQHLELHPRPFAPEGPERAGQEGRPDRRRDRDAQRAALDALQLRGLVGKACDLVQHALRALVDTLSGGGQAHAGGGAVKDRDPDLFLDLQHEPRQRRLAAPERLRGLAKAARARDFHDGLNHHASRTHCVKFRLTSGRPAPLR